MVYTCRYLKRPNGRYFVPPCFPESSQSCGIHIHGFMGQFLFQNMVVTSIRETNLLTDLLEKKYINKSGMLKLALTSSRTEARNGKQLREVHERCHVCMQRLKTSSERLKRAFRLRSISLCS